MFGSSVFWVIEPEVKLISLEWERKKRKMHYVVLCVCNYTLIGKYELIVE